MESSKQKAVSRRQWAEGGRQKAFNYYYQLSNDSMT